jgi:hypothetical protein
MPRELLGRTSRSGNAAPAAGGALEMGAGQALSLRAPRIDDAR